MKFVRGGITLPDTRRNLTMRTHSLAAALFLTLLVPQTRADTFVLKDGSTIEGQLLREDAENYVIEVQVTRTIKDEKIVPKADVDKILREKPDLKAFESVATLVPAPDMLTSEQYGTRIRAVEKFLSEHRGSAKTTEARAILATLKEEANEILAGGIKTGGRILPPAEYRANALEIDARGGEARIRELVAGGNFLQALREFKQFEVDFRGTRSHTELLPLIQQTINRYLAEIEQLRGSYDKRMKERETGLERMQFDDRRNAQAAIAEELELAEQQYTKEKAERLGWITPHPNITKSLDDTLSFGKQELSRLAATPQTHDTGKAYRDALRKISTTPDATARNAALAEARSAGVPANYLSKLEAAAAR
jgi:hypothetical protein